jgi:hypothetical protein
VIEDSFAIKICVMYMARSIEDVLYYLNVMSCDVQLGGQRFPFILSLILAKYFLENRNALLTLLRDSLLVSTIL